MKGDVFQNLPVQSVDRGIQGRLAGVQIQSASGAPGGALTVRVRGVGSINANNDPLWIIDGVQLSRFGQTTQGSSNPLASINPNDIESV
nr:Plug domain-containing protein [Cyclobacteriaceae bacterium]